MGKYLFYALGLILAAAAPLRADVTVSDGNADTFAAAVSNTITAGGGTITVTVPIDIGDTNGNFDARTFDGQSKVTVSGGNKNSIFIVNNGNLVLSNMTLTGGVGQFGGAMAISDAGVVTLIGCVFANNRVLGADGASADSGTNSGGRDVAVGRNGARGEAGEPAYGGAIYNLGSLELFQCKFLTNSATGGTGGDGSDGEDAGTRGGNGGGGGAGGSVAGAAVFNMGSVLVISNCTFSGNKATGGSGGIGGAGGSAIVGGVNGFAGLTGIASGGGLYTAASMNAVVLSSTFDHNTVQGGDGSEGGTSGSGAGQTGPRGGDALGGGIENSGFLLITNSTFYQNSAIGGAGGDGGVGGVKGGNGGPGGSAIGGGVYNSGDITVANCTFSKETASGGDAGNAGSGAGAAKNGKAGGNFGGHIANVAKKKHGAFHLMNSILGIALSGNGGYGTIIDDQYNISADKSIKFKKKKSTSLMNTNALSGGGDLADNGGPTLTIALNTNSVAIDFIPPELTLTNDQRGFLRPIEVRTNQSDAGAYEVDPKQVTILSQPNNVIAIVGSNATFSVAAGGLGPLFYQWFFNNSAISNAMDSTLTITNVQPVNGGNYFVIVTNSFNAVTSSVAVLTATVVSNSAPVITVQPVARQDVLAGTTVTISVTVTSSTPVLYQWFFEDQATFNTFLLAGATNNVLTMANVQVTNSGLYEVIATNIAGAVTSSVSKLVVTNASTDPGNPGDPGDPGFPGIPGAMNTIPIPSLWELPMPASEPGNAMLMADAEPNPPARKVFARMLVASSSPEPRHLVGIQLAVLRQFDRRWRC
jgi:hypothetical protein